MSPPILQLGRTNVYQAGYSLDRNRYIGTGTIGAMATIPLPRGAELTLVGPNFSQGRIINDANTRETYGLSGSLFVSSPKLFGNFRLLAGLHAGFDLIRPELTDAFHTMPRLGASVGLRAAPFIMGARDAFGSFDITQVDGQTFFGLSGGITFDAL